VPVDHSPGCSALPLRRGGPLPYQIVSRRFAQLRSRLVAAEVTKAYPLLAKVVR
jgi:hypothetical protein